MGDISFQEYSLYAACVLGLMLAVECLAIWVGGAFCRLLAGHPPHRDSRFLRACLLCRTRGKEILSLAAPRKREETRRPPPLPFL